MRFASLVRSEKSQWENDINPNDSGLTHSTLLGDLFPTSNFNSFLFSLHCMKLVVPQYGLQTGRYDTEVTACGND
jgi:hypothetical protein